MKKIKDCDITVTKHNIDGFTLSCIADDNNYYKHRYIGYGLRQAKQRFKMYVLTEMETNAKYWKGRTDEVVIQALRCICGGDLVIARQLLNQ